MKGFAGMRGMAGAIIAAVAEGMSGFGPMPKDSILNRAPGFMGIGPKFHGIRNPRSKYKPHQGKQECARRVSQMRRGMLRYSNCGELTPF